MITVPDTWEFIVSTPAFDPQNPNNKLGDFQPGITVKVIEAHLKNMEWLVVFERHAAPDIRAFVAIPDLSQKDPTRFAQILPLIKGFPLIQAQFEAEEPWPDEVESLARRLLGENVAIEAGSRKAPLILRASKINGHLHVWEQLPLNVFCDYSQTPKITIDLWNKREAYRAAVNVTFARHVIREKLEALERFFRAWDNGSRPRKELRSDVTALHDRSEVFFLPNNICATLRYKNSEHFFLELSPIVHHATPAAPALPSGSDG